MLTGIGIIGVLEWYRRNLFLTNSDHFHLMKKLAWNTCGFPDKVCFFTCNIVLAAVTHRSVFAIFGTMRQRILGMFAFVFCVFLVVVSFSSLGWVYSNVNCRTVWKTLCCFVCFVVRMFEIVRKSFFVLFILFLRKWQNWSCIQEEKTLSWVELEVFQNMSL